MTYSMPPAEAIEKSANTLESLGTVLAKVGELMADQPAEIDAIFSSIEAVVKYTQIVLQQARTEPDSLQDYNELTFAFRLMEDVLLKVLVPPQLAWVEVGGNALAPSFRERDIVFYDPSRPDRVSDGYYVVEFEHGVRVQRLQSLITESRIVSIYEDERFTREYLPEDPSSYKVLGPVIGCIKRF